MKLGRDVAENLVATVVDFGSTLVSYRLGVAQMGVGLGVAYAALSALVVIWMRGPMTAALRRLLRRNMVMDEQGIMRRRR